MSKRSVLIGLGVVACLALVVSGCSNRAASTDTTNEPGITATSIKIGSSMPYSGPLAVFGQYGDGAKAYFNYINDQGGVDGRKIDFVVYDDAGTPDRTVQNVNKLVQQDKVFALAFIFGTASNLAVRDNLNAEKIPHLFQATGFPAFGSSDNIKKYPWTMGWMPSYALEAAVDAEYLKAHLPDAKVAILYQNDDLGASLVSGFETAAKGSNLEVVAKQSYNVSDPTVNSQITALANSGATVFLNYTQGTFTSQSISAMVQAGWSPTTFIPSFDTAVSILEPAGLENAKGFLAPVYLKDPQDTSSAEQADIKKYEEIITKYGDGADPKSHNIAFGFTEAELFVKALSQMKEPTRAALMDSVRNLKDVSLTMLLPGITATTGPNDGYPLETVYLQKFDGKSWVTTNEKYGFEGKSSSLLP